MKILKPKEVSEKLNVTSWTLYGLRKYKNKLKEELKNEGL